jgi:hypothetical protein
MIESKLGQSVGQHEFCMCAVISNGHPVESLTEPLKIDALHIINEQSRAGSCNVDCLWRSGDTIVPSLPLPIHISSIPYHN